MRYEWTLRSVGDTFNRTIVELKLAKRLLYSRTSFAFNRTIVELKPVCAPDRAGQCDGF